MWRIVLFIGFICSIALNVYLFLQLNVRAIETKFQQGIRIAPQQRLADMQNNKDEAKSIAKASFIDSTKNAQKIVSKIKNSLNGKDYVNANFLIHTLANDQQAELSQIRLFWLQAIQTLIEQKLFTHAEDAINAYLAFQSDDIDFLYQQVDLYWQQQLPLLAIKYAYEVQYHLFNRVDVREAMSVARGVVQQQVDVLINNNDWLALRGLIENVLLFDPQSLNLQWLFARTQYQLGEFDSARNAIEPLLTQPNYKIKARALLAEIEAKFRTPQSIPLSRQGEHFIVQANINDTFNVSLMLDTGASISLLSESAFDALNQYSEVIYLKDLNLNTAGGQVTASLYQVDEFAIKGYVVNDFVFAVTSTYVNGDSEKNDGLLGMNFLKAFDFHIDQNNSLLILKNK
ncbi:MAG: clan AA aspartic protease (TIGR02281 family) [Alteromonadaceae bacterium]|jgi:clan AA aspartic protease (TIGR02281 family)